MKTIITLGEFDLGSYIGCTFLHRGRDAILTMNIDNEEISIRFEGSKYYQFTALHNCTSDMISAYFKLVDLGKTGELSLFIENDSATLKSYKNLSHFRIFLDEAGCFDVFAEQAIRVE